VTAIQDRPNFQIFYQETTMCLGGISPGHTPDSLMIGGHEKTDEATITQERGFFGQPTKTVIDAGKGDDVINIHTNPNGSVDVTINGEVHSFSAEEAKNLEVRGGKGNDTIVCTGEAEPMYHILGGPGGFVGWGDNPNLTIDGGKGDDIIMGSSGDDTIRGGSGDDIIFGGGGNDNIDGGRGNDTIMGGDGNDQIHGGRGNDFIMGNHGNDHVYGDQGRDDVYGGQGRDWVQGGSKEQNFIEKIFDMPSQKDSVNERSFLDVLMRGLRG
jgi:Ca2+-binding RTX toxin-like protein